LGQRNSPSSGSVVAGIAVAIIPASAAVAEERICFMVVSFAIFVAASSLRRL
jgi:hypothetical protein